MSKNFKNKNIKILIASLLLGAASTFTTVSATGQYSRSRRYKNNINSSRDYSSKLNAQSFRNSNKNRLNKKLEIILSQIDYKINNIIEAKFSIYDDISKDKKNSSNMEKEYKNLKNDLYKYFEKNYNDLKEKDPELAKKLKNEYEGKKKLMLSLVSEEPEEIKPIKTPYSEENSINKDKPSYKNNRNKPLDDEGIKSIPTPSSRRNSINKNEVELKKQYDFYMNKINSLIKNLEFNKKNINHYIENCLEIDERVRESYEKTMKSLEECYKEGYYILEKLDKELASKFKKEYENKKKPLVVDFEEIKSERLKLKEIEEAYERQSEFIKDYIAHVEGKYDFFVENYLKVYENYSIEKDKDKLRRADDYITDYAYDIDALNEHYKNTLNEIKQYSSSFALKFKNDFEERIEAIVPVEKLKEKREEALYGRSKDLFNESVDYIDSETEKIYKAYKEFVDFYKNPAKYQIFYEENDFLERCKELKREYDEKIENLNKYYKECYRNLKKYNQSDASKLKYKFKEKMKNIQRIEFSSMKRKNLKHLYDLRVDEIKDLIKKAKWDWDLIADANHIGRDQEFIKLKEVHLQIRFSDLQNVFKYLYDCFKEEKRDDLAEKFEKEFNKMMTNSFGKFLNAENRNLFNLNNENEDCPPHVQENKNLKQQEENLKKYNEAKKELNDLEAPNDERKITEQHIAKMKKKAEDNRRKTKDKQKKIQQIKKDINAISGEAAPVSIEKETKKSKESVENNVNLKDMIYELRQKEWDLDTYIKDLEKYKNKYEDSKSYIGKYIKDAEEKIKELEHKIEIAKDTDILTTLQFKLNRKERNLNNYNKELEVYRKNYEKNKQIYEPKIKKLEKEIKELENSINSMQN